MFYRIPSLNLSKTGPVWLTTNRRRSSIAAYTQELKHILSAVVLTTAIIAEFWRPLEKRGKRLITVNTRETLSLYQKLSAMSIFLDSLRLSFNDFAFTVQFKRLQNFRLYLPFHAFHVRTLHRNLLFSNSILGLVFSAYVVLCVDILLHRIRIYRYIITCGSNRKKYTPDLFEYSSRVNMCWFLLLNSASPSDWMTGKPSLEVTPITLATFSSSDSELWL